MKNHAHAPRKDRERKAPVEFTERAKAFLAHAPRALVEEVRAHPYRTLGFACAVGFGGGVVVGSRILRSAVASMIGATLMEVVRHYIQSEIANRQQTGDADAHVA